MASFRLECVGIDEKDSGPTAAVAAALLTVVVTALGGAEWLLVALVVLTLITMGFLLATQDIHPATSIPFLLGIAIVGLVAWILHTLVGLGAVLGFAVNLRREKS